MAERFSPCAHTRAPQRPTWASRVASLLACLICLGALVCTGATAVAGTAAARDAETQRIAATLRCVVCQNQSIADSQSGLAIDLRGQIDRLLAQGHSEAEIRAYMVQRYGEYILYQPALRPSTLLLWFGPFALLALALWVAWSVVRPAARRAAAADLLPDDPQRLLAQRLLRTRALAPDEPRHWTPGGQAANTPRDMRHPS